MNILLGERGTARMWKGHELPCLAWVPLTAPPCAHRPGSSLNPILLGCLWSLHYIGVIHHYLYFQPLSPVWRMEGRDKNSKL